jgi:hypothetical protein
MKMPNIMFSKFTVAQSELAKHFLYFLSVLTNLYLYLLIFTNFYLYLLLLGVGTSHGCFSGKEGEIQVFAGPAPYSQTAGSSLRLPGWQSWPEKFSKM